MKELDAQLEEIPLVLIIISDGRGLGFAVFFSLIPRTEAIS